jgi:hypothetical protein
VAFLFAAVALLVLASATRQSQLARLYSVLAVGYVLLLSVHGAIWPMATCCLIA